MGGARRSGAERVLRPGTEGGPGLSTAFGVRLATDDFGTGYSSLNHLKRFPVDVVKIDRGFVGGVDTTPVDSAIVTAVLGLADAVGMTTVAEGVDTAGQLDRLRELECPLVQGYHLGRPASADDVAVTVGQSLRSRTKATATA